MSENIRTYYNNERNNLNYNRLEWRCLFSEYLCYKSSIYDEKP